MTRMLRMAALALALGAIAVPAFAADSDPVVARINGTALHRSEVVKELQHLGPQAQQVPVQVIYPQILEKMIVTKIVAQKGYAQKIQNDKEVKDRLKQAEEKIVADVYVTKTVEPKITEEKLKAQYDELAAKFKPEDEVRARHILVSTEAEANDLLKQIKDGGDFARLATEKSKDTGSSKKGGDLGYFTKADMVKPFSEAAFAMKNGEISDKPVKTDFGYHILKVEDRRKSSPPPMAEVKEQLRAQVGQKMVESMIKDLEASANIERFNLDGSVMKPAEKAEKK